MRSPAPTVRNPPSPACAPGRRARCSATVKSPITSHRSPGIEEAFTLIEIMIVIGILGIVLAMGVPAIYRVVHREGMRKAVADIVEICSNARAQAILQGVTAEVRFHPLDRRLEATGGGGASRPASAEGIEISAPVPVRSGLSAQLPEGVIIEMLDVNFIEYREAEEARVRFFPNGTCDEMTIILRSDRGEFQKISLEITTGLANVESDPRRW